MLRSKGGLKGKLKPVARRNAPVPSSSAPETASASQSQSQSPAPPTPAPVEPVDAGTSEPLTQETPAASTTDTNPSAQPSNASPSLKSTTVETPTEKPAQTTSSRASDEQEQDGGSRASSSSQIQTSQVADKEPLTAETPSTSQDSTPQPNTSAPSASTEAESRAESQHVVVPSPTATPTIEAPAKPASTSAPIPPNVPSTSSPAARTGRTRSSSRSSATDNVPVPQPEPAPIPQSEPTPTVPAAAPIENNSSSEPQTSVESATESTTQPTSESSAARQPRRPRKRNASDSNTEAGSQQGESSSAPAPQRPRRRAAALPGEEGYVPNQARKTTRKRKAPAGTESRGPAAEDGEAADQPAAKRPPRQREATPENAEAMKIDINQVKMADLAKDMGIGKKFSLHDKLLEQERLKRQKAIERKRQKKNGTATGNDGEGTGTPAPGEGADGDAGNGNNTAGPGTSTNGNNDNDNDEESSGRPAGHLPPAAETYRIVNGEIVIDESSLRLNRHARAAEEAGELEEQEENDFTNAVTSATYLRRNLKPQQWTDEETEQFYQALSSFGTDFETISMMFPGKTRKHIKLKYNREERTNPTRINEAILGKKTVAMSLEDYQRHTGKVYETTEAIEAELQKNQEEFDARERALVEEREEENRKKREELFANKDNAEAEGGKKKRGRGKKAKEVASIW